jgi:GxxExxY protein
MGSHREIGPGKRENTYQRSMEVRMTDAGVAYVAQKLLEVRDQGVLVGYYIPDFIVEEVVIVEIKALSWLDNSHLRQIIGYMAVTGCPVGLLINFGRRSLEYRRIFPPKDITEHRISRQWLYVPDSLK